MVTRYPALAPLTAQIEAAVDLLCRCYYANGTVLTCGNGGSAADSAHIVGELMKGFTLRREVPPTDAECLRQAGYADWEALAAQLQQGIPAMALTDQVPLSSAIANDISAEMVFAQQVYAFGHAGDVLIGLSTSGNAKNVVNALRIARAFGLSTIGMTGMRPSTMDEFCDVLLKVPEFETYKVQEYHLPVYHTICAMLEHRLFGQGNA
jgi:D-sedoheptulose 7-phosphate isomerase